MANQAMLNLMLARKEKEPLVPEIGDLLAISAESLKIYNVYASNYPAAMKIIQQLQSKPEGKELLNVTPTNLANAKLYGSPGTQSRIVPNQACPTNLQISAPN